MKPQGWQNLSPTRKTIDRDRILAVVQQEHPEAIQAELTGGLLAYSMPDNSVVALAWIDPRKARWTYVVLPRGAYEIGGKCSLIPLDGKRFRVVPFRTEENPAIHEQIDASYRRRRPVDTSFEQFFYEEADGWYVEFEIGCGEKKSNHQFGPYKTYDDILPDLPRLTEHVQKIISNKEAA